MFQFWVGYFKLSKNESGLGRIIKLSKDGLELGWIYFVEERWFKV